MYRIQRADLLPSLDAAGGSVAERLPADISPTGTTQINRRYDVAGVATAWELDLWGRIRNLSDRALASYLALDETRVAAQMSLVSEVAIAYLTLRADQALLTLTSDTRPAPRGDFTAYRRGQPCGLYPTGSQRPQCPGIAVRPTADGGTVAATGCGHNAA